MSYGQTAPYGKGRGKLTHRDRQQPDMAQEFGDHGRMSHSHNNYNYPRDRQRHGGPQQISAEQPTAATHNCGGGNIDYDWDPDGVTEDMEHLSIRVTTAGTYYNPPRNDNMARDIRSTTGSATSSAYSVPLLGRNPIPLENFFEFASKDLPVLPPGSLSSYSGPKPEWVPPPVQTNNLWTTDTPVADDTRFGDGKDDKNYVEQYKKALEDRIAMANAFDPEDNINLNHHNLMRTPGDCPSEMDGSYMNTLSSVDQDTSLVGTIPAPGLMIDEADDIWNHFHISTFNYRQDTSQLAVFKYKDQIMSALESNQVTIVEGYTGCGKSTQIPQYILEKYCESGRRCNIVVTQPRRLAATAVAHRVCDEKGWEIGSVVGFQVGLSRKTSQSTRLTYVTTGILLQSLISKKCLDEYSHIIVDEVHERDLETDLLLLVLKKILVERLDKTTKVILMSATLNPQKFADYFPKWPSMDLKVSAAVVQIPPESVFPVTEYYLDTIGGNFALEEQFDEPRAHEQCYRLAVDYVVALDEKEISEDNEKGRPNVNERTRGGVLIFLPGYLEIETMVHMLTEFSFKRTQDPENPVQDKWVILPLHSTITSEEQQKVFHRVASGYRKIVVATNIAESSITVTDMRYVIDFCLTKSLGCDPTTNYTCLRMEWASQDQCTQRRGRVGRVAPGCVFRMVPKQFWAGLGKETVPDMEKSSLENVVLKVKNLNMGSPKSILALAIDPPKLSLIARAVVTLKEVGALTINTGPRYTKHDGDLTQMGLIMSKLPLDVRFSRLIVLGHIFGVLEETIIIAAGLSGKSPFSHPFSKRLNAYMSKLSWSNETFSDYFAILCLYRTWRFKWESKTIRDSREERQWAREYFVQLNMMKEIRNLVIDICKRLRNLNIDVDQVRLVNEEMTAERGLLLKIAIAGAFYPNYFLRQRPTQKEYEKNILKELSCCNPMHTLYFSGYPQDQPGQLYADSIASYFKTGNSMPNVQFSGGKVLVQFDPRGDTLGCMSLTIYRGIKMRQLRQCVTFGTMRPDNSHDLLSDEIGRAKLLRYLACPQQVEVPKVTESVFKVIVTHLEMPDLFWVVYEGKVTTVEEIAATLDEFAKHTVPLKFHEAVVGCLCVVEFQGRHFRGRIDYKQNSTDILVYLIDHGNSVWRKVHEVNSFNQDLCDRRLDTIEAQAIQCRIYGIKPLAKYSSLWSKEANKRFASFAVENILYLQVFSVVESVVACDLSHTDVFDERQSIRNLLVKESFASILEETHISKDNNYLRYRINASGGIGGVKEEDLKHHNIKQIRRDVRPLSVRAPNERDLVTETTLRGAFTPLEMDFNSLCRSAHMKQVQIDRSSVNSVALDQEPMSLTARLLVAGTVNVAQKTGSVLARDTTIMPAIPGLVGILTMMFCPKLELRVDFPLGRYTGCVSGLGIDPVNRHPIYADHDVEIVFDTVFDDDDLRKINSIRSTMNCILRGQSAIDINNLRDSVRDDLNVLLERDRPTVEEEAWQDIPHKWGLIDERLLIQYNVKGDEDGAVFPTHKTVRMTLGADEVIHTPTRSNKSSTFDYEYEY